jgi:hypothetical protein
MQAKAAAPGQQNMLEVDRPESGSQDAWGAEVPQETIFEKHAPSSRMHLSARPGRRLVFLQWSIINMAHVGGKSG